MSSNKFSIIITTLVASVLLLAFASAQITFNPASVNATGNPGTGVSVSFNLNNSDNTNYNLSWSLSPSNSGWTLPLQSTIDSMQVISLTALYNIASDANPGMAQNVNIVVNASNSTYSATASIPVKIFVNSVSSFTLVEQVALTKTRNATVNITNTGNTQLNLNITPSGSFALGLSEKNFVLNKGSSKTINAYPLNLNDLKFGNNVASISVLDLNSNVTNSLSLSSLQKSFCAIGPLEKRNLSINDFEITALLGKSDKWKLLDEIKVDVEIKNIGRDDVDDIYVELGLFDANTGEDVTNKLDFTNADEETINLGNLDDGERQSVTFEFKVPADFEKGNYRLAVKAYSKDIGEDIECVDSSSSISSSRFYKEITVERESDKGKYIAFDGIRLTPSDAVCGDSVTLNLKAVNVGKGDQKRVRVNLYNNELGIDTFFELKNGIDEGRDKAVQFIFIVPKVQDKTYQLSLSSDYDYSGNTYRQSSDDIVKVPLKVFGCGPVSGQPTAKIASISAVLASDAKSGKPLTIKATIKNLGNVTMPFVISARAFDSWAELSSISDPLINLAPEESREVTLSFDVKSSASGKQTFVIEARSSDKVETKEIEVNIEKSALFPALNLGGNTLVWVIGALNVILVIIIIIVAVRVARR